MPYLIDGHNLIPKIPGQTLRDPDDEQALIELLQEFCRRRRKEVEIYFDGAPPGQPRAHNFGAVKARFVRHGSSADEAIRERLGRLGRSARNWTVVSSDRAVQTSARAARAAFLPSEVFAEQIMLAIQESNDSPSARSEASLSEDELDDWLEFFHAGPEDSDT
jgi:predicted RNA-binding protein with PIN domain